MLNFLLVPVIMGCAMGGTVGIIKVIQKVFSGGATGDLITKKIENTMKERGE